MNLNAICLPTHEPESVRAGFFGGDTVRVLPLACWLNIAAGAAQPKIRVDLPMIQRGFVWKPKQIIDLWDSLLSGMPIGALMVSELQHDQPTEQIGDFVLQLFDIAPLTLKGVVEPFNVGLRLCAAQPNRTARRPLDLTQA